MSFHENFDLSNYLTLVNQATFITVGSIHACILDKEGLSRWRV